MVCNMINSLFDKRTMKRFDDLANKEAKLNNKKKNLVKETMEKIDAVTLVNVFKIVKKTVIPVNKNVLKKLNRNMFPVKS